MVFLSPNLYGKGGSLEIADATADLRKSMIVKPQKQRVKESALELGFC